MHLFVEHRQNLTKSRLATVVESVAKMTMDSETRK